MKASPPRQRSGDTSTAEGHLNTAEQFQETQSHLLSHTLYLGTMPINIVCFIFFYLLLVSLLGPFKRYHLCYFVRSSYCVPWDILESIIAYHLFTTFCPF